LRPCERNGWSLLHSCLLNRCARPSLAAEADDGLTLLVVCPKSHDAIVGMIGDPEDEAPVRVRSRLVLAVQAYRGLPRPAQPTGDPQLAGCDHSLIDDDLRHGRAMTQDDGTP
jgi:hypothetical protein